MTFAENLPFADSSVYVEAVGKLFDSMGLD